MSKPMLMATMMDSDRNAWSLRICPNGAIVLVYLGEQIGELEPSEGTAILNRRTDAGERLEAVLASLEAIAARSTSRPDRILCRTHRGSMRIGQCTIN